MNTIQLVPDIYIPLWSKNSYQDHLNDFPSDIGIVCKCNTRKTVFTRKTKFKQHCKTKTHKKYLKSLVEIEANPLRKVYELEKIVKVQQTIIKKYEKEIASFQNNVEIDDLLGIN